GDERHRALRRRGAGLRRPGHRRARPARRDAVGQRAGRGGRSAPRRPRPRRRRLNDRHGYRHPMRGASAAREDALVRGLLTGIAAYRWLAWGWMAIVLLLSRDELQEPEARPLLAVVLVGAALAVTAVTSVL